MYKWAYCCLATAMMAGCATIANPFTSMAPDYSAVPQEALRTTAAAIERAVAESDREAHFEDNGGLVINTPDLQQAIRTRAARASLVKSFMDSGHACEMRSGLLRILRTTEYKKSTNKRERDRHALLVMSENNDRWAIYEGLLKSSHLPPRARSAIQDAFFQARIDLLSQGNRYEAEDGQLVAK